MIQVVTGFLAMPSDFDPIVGYLVARRSGNRHYVGCWETPGGKVEEGETHQEALIREWWEELHLHISVGAHIHSGKYEPDEGQPYELHAYYVTAPSLMGMFPIAHDLIRRLSKDKILALTPTTPSLHVVAQFLPPEKP